MATEKNPSIYYDRGTIGSSDELDEYGVWVKSEPQDLSSVNKESSDIPEPSIIGMEDLPDIDETPDISFTNDSTDILDLPDMDENFSDDLDINLNLDDVPGDIDIPVMEDADSTGDIRFSGNTGTEEMDLSIPEMEDTELAGDDSFDLDINFDDDLPAGTDLPTSEAGLEEDETVTISETEDISGEAHGFSEVSMDDFLSDSPKDEDVISSADIDEDLLDINFDDIDQDPGKAEDLPDIDSIISLDDDASFSDDEPITIDDIDEENRGSINFDDVAALSDDLHQQDDTPSKTETEDISLDDDISFEEDEPITIDDIDEVNRSSINFDGMGSNIPQEPKSEKEDVSTELLLKIANELSSIREELSSLKNELSSIKTEGPAEAPEFEAPPEDSKGFFDEEDDDKIALTGDELDNILNTADFTEEAGEDANKNETEYSVPEAEFPAEEPAENEPEDFIMDGQDLLTGDEDELNVPAEQEIDEQETEFDVSDVSMDLGDDLSRTDENGNTDFELDLDEALGQKPVPEEEFPGIDIPPEEESVPEEEPEVLTSQAPVSGDEGVITEEISFDSFTSFDKSLAELEDAEEDDGEILTEVEDKVETAEEPLEDYFLDDASLVHESELEEVDDLSLGDFSLEENTAGQAETEEIPDIEKEEISLDTDIEEKDTEELKQLREEGVLHFTEAPEDISYLQEEDLENIDLSGAVIDEPDFSDIVENPVNEPSLEDLSIDLDLEEEPLLTEDGEIPLGDTDLEEEHEIELSIPDLDDSETSFPGLGQDEPEEESFAQVIPEGFVVEPEDSEIALDESELDFEEIETVRPEDEHILAPMEEDSPILADDLAVEEAIPVLEDEALSSMAVPGNGAIPQNLKQELRTVLSYMDKLLESLPEDKIEEFAKSEYFDTYKKLFEELGLV